MNCRLPVLFSFILAVSFQGSNTHVVPDVVYLPDFLSGMQQFSGDFYKAMVETHEGNWVSSPISAMTLLGMAGYGTEGHTKEEIIAALHMPFSEGLVLRNYRKLLMDMNNAKGVELHLANKLFIQDGLDLEWVYNHVTDVIFQSSTKNIDFQDTSSAAEAINNWSKEKTNDKIPEIVSAADLEKKKLLLTNSAYFKGQWVNSFGSDLIDRPFHLANNSSITIPMMCNNIQYNYGPIPGVNADYIEIPYENKDSTEQFSMFLISPKEVNGVDAIGEKLGEMNFTAMNAPKRQLNLCIPKFEINSKLDLTVPFQKMGVHDLFSDDANLKNMGRFHELKVDSIMQNAFISVDQHGTEAAATSEIDIGTKDSMTIDRPFIAMIHLKNPGAPIFMARITDPRM